MSAPASLFIADRASAERDRSQDASANPKPSSSACAVPARDDQAAHPLDQVGDRVVGRDVAEPGRLDQVAREARGAQEQGHEQQREDRPGSPRRYRAAAPAARRGSRTRTRSAIDSSSSTSTPPTPLAKSTPVASADEQVDDRLHQPSTSGAAELPDSSASLRSGVSASRLKKPVSMSRARSVPAVIDDEHRALHERHREQERRGSCGSGSRGCCVAALSARAVDREQDQREQHREDEQRALAQVRTTARSPTASVCASERADGRLSATRRRLAAGGRPSSGAVAAPSSLRPVLARNTSSSEGWCSCSVSTCRSVAVEHAHDLGELGLAARQLDGRRCRGRRAAARRSGSAARRGGRRRPGRRA